MRRCGFQGRRLRPRRPRRRRWSLRSSRTTPRQSRGNAHARRRRRRLPPSRPHRERPSGRRRRDRRRSCGDPARDACLRTGLRCRGGGRRRLGDQGRRSSISGCRAPWPRERGDGVPSRSPSTVRARCDSVSRCCSVALAASADGGRRGASGTSRRASRGAFARPYVSLGRTGAIAVDARTGDVLFAHNANGRSIPPRTRSSPSPGRRSPGSAPAIRFRTERARRRRSASGSTWEGDLFIGGYGDPTLTTADVGRLAARVRARASRG